MAAKFHCIALMVITLVTTPCSSIVNAADDAFSRSTLLVLKGVYVVVADLGQAIEQQGVKEERLKKSTERRLRAAGIEVLPMEKWKAFGYPHLYIKPKIIKHASSQEYFYNISVELRQVVFLSRKPVIEAFGTTWSTSTLGMTSDLDDIQTGVMDLIDQFINAYFSMNPR